MRTVPRSPLRKSIWFVLFALVVCAAGVESASNLATTREQVIARIDGHPIPRSEYLEFLYREYGRSRMSSFLDDRLVARRANELGVAVESVELRRLVDQKIEGEIRRLFDGDRSRFEESLARRCMTFAQYRDWKIGRERGRRLVDQCLLAVREVTSAEVVNKFEELYGPRGVHRRVRHVFLLGDRELAARRSPARSIDPRSAEAIAAEILEVAANDPDRFPQLIERHSDNLESRANGGQLPSYRPGESTFGVAFDRAVAELDKPRQVTGIVPASNGLHIVQLLEKNVTRLDSVREEIREHLRRRPPTAKERGEFFDLLRKRARIEL